MFYGLSFFIFATKQNWHCWYSFSDYGPGWTTCGICCLCKENL